jgi:N-acetylmuramoyl-L-alanine amidase CwlA
MNRYMNTSGQRFSRTGHSTMVDATRIESIPLDYATWHARIKGHNDGGASPAINRAPDARTA